MQTVWKGRMTQAAAKYGEIAPTATVCCNACRTCVQTNLIAVALAGIAAAARTLLAAPKRQRDRARPLEERPAPAQKRA
jgi:hypothetical protein